MNAKTIELLAPAGDKETFLLALSNGADAIYLAGKSFGARASAQNFSNEEIKECIDLAHVLYKKVYVTINTLLFDYEFLELELFVEFLVQANVDAVIIQDIGVLEFLSKTFPLLELHASTQMNVHTVEHAQLLKNLGVKRIVLARETPLDTIKEIIKKVDIEIEVFAHGALCVSYSGNCLMSSFIGKRSGNRGKCAQPCRLSYQLDEDAEKKHILSTKDLMTLEDLQVLIDANITSLKIEGRLKRKEYVAQVVKSYKKMLQKIINNVPMDIELEKKELEKVFNREFTKGFLLHADNLDITNTKSVNHQGIVIGKVVRVSSKEIEIALDAPLEKGDGVRIKGKAETGFFVEKIYLNHKLITQASANSLITLPFIDSVEVGDLLHLTSETNQLTRLSKLSLPKIALQGWIYVEEEYLVLSISDGEHAVIKRSSEKVQVPLKQPTSSQRILDQIQKIQDTVYFFQDLEIHLENEIFIPISTINALKTETLLELSGLRQARQAVVKHEYTFEPVATTKTSTGFVAKVHTMEQLDSCVVYPLQAIYIASYDLYVKGKAKYPNSPLLYHENRILPKQTNETQAVVGNIGRLLEKNYPVSSVYLNITNAYAAYKMKSLGASIIGLSVELSKDQISQLLKTYFSRYNSKLPCEVMVYGHHEMMILKHDFLKKENKAENIAHTMKDRKGFTYEIRKDEADSTVIYNPMRLHLLDEIKTLQDMGVMRFLLDFTTESYQATTTILEMYLNDSSFTEKQRRPIENMTYGHYKDGVL